MATETATSTDRYLTLRCQFCDTWNRVDAGRAKDRPKCGKCGRPLLLDRPWPLTDETFAKTIAETTVPVLVDFYADWCGPCKMMAPLVDQLAANYTGQALVAKLNTDYSPKTSEQFQIRGIPTTIVFRNGKEAARVTGALPYPSLEQLLKSNGAGSGA
ncbi:MAG TPA: thioredoxin [Gemmatimonadaceae bacterium]|nr:thioredoxin [Gemmatimonadaceae bacterium]